MEFRTFSPVRYNAPVKTHESDRKNTVSFGATPSEDKPVQSRFKKWSIPLLLASLTGGAFMGIGPNVSEVAPAKPVQVQQEVSKNTLSDADAKWVRSKLTDRSEEEVNNILDWMNRYDLNRYGDAKGTRYLGGTPLFNESTGETMTLYEYLESMSPNQIWNQESRVLEALQDFNSEAQESVVRWMHRHQLNEYGDPSGTNYLGGTPLFDERSGAYIPLSEYLIDKASRNPGQIQSSWTQEAWVYDHLQDKSHREREQVIQWMTRQSLNQYGDSLGKIYREHHRGPLFDSKTGEFQKLSSYLANNYPKKPWLKEKL